MSAKAPTRIRMTSDERKASIVEAAVRLFSEKGFRGTTTRELAAAVGVTEPVLYEHFRTKRDLYSAIIESKASEGLQTLAVLEQTHSASGDDTGFFTALGLQIVDWYTRDPSFVRLLLFSNLENHELKDLLHERSREFFDTVGRYISLRISQGSMRSMDPELAARAYFGMVAHYALTGLIFEFAPLKATAKEIVDGMVTIFLGGLCTKDQAR